MKIYLSHSSGYDYENLLYNPLKSSEICKAHEVYFPHDNEPVNTKTLLKSFDLIVAEVSEASTGQGIELGWGDYYGIPILCVYKTGSKISSAIKLITKNVISYDNSTDLIAKLRFFISNNFNLE